VDVGSIQKRQAHTDKADDHNSESANEGPLKIVVGVLLLEPLNFNFITRPTKNCLPNVRGHVTTMERFRFVNAPELDSPRGFHLWLSH
jgi:hypothetical protein